MAALFTPLKPVVFQGNNRIDHHLGLQLSSSVESVIDYVDINAKLSQPCCVLIYGEPGCGRTTLLLEIANAFLANGLRNSEILGVRVRPGCSVESLWNYLSEISKDKQDKDTASLLSQSTAKLNKKYSTAQNFLSSNFKLVLIDDVYSDGGIVWSHLSQMLLKVNAAAIVVCTKKDAPSVQSTLTEQAVLSVELKGLCMDSFKKYLNSKILYSRLSEDQQWKIFSMLNGNPTALKILVNTVNEYKLPSESLECIIPSWSEDMKTEKENDSCSTLLQFTFSHLDAREKQVFDQLCQLREPLPAVKFPEEVEKLIRLGLVKKWTFDLRDDAVEVIHSVSVVSCLQHSLSPAAASDVQVPFSAFDAWHSLLSEKLCQLITDAKGNAWPFVPEKW